jgi:hypothetical protein
LKNGEVEKGAFWGNRIFHASFFGENVIKSWGFHGGAPEVKW